MPAGLPVWAGAQPAIPAGLGQQPPSTRLEFCSASCSDDPACDSTCGCRPAANLESIARLWIRYGDDDHDAAREVPRVVNREYDFESDMS